MLEKYFARPSTLDRIQASWLAEPIERYVRWLESRGSSPTLVRCRVPILVAFGDFAASRGATTCQELPAHVSSFIREREQSRLPRLRPRTGRGSYGDEHRRAIEQMLQCVLPDFQGSFQRKKLPMPFAAQVPGFFPYLRDERGLRETTLVHYIQDLRIFERYLARSGRPNVRRLNPKVLRGLIEEASRTMAVSRVGGICDAVRVFVRFLYREGLLSRDLTRAIERPRRYHMATVPRSIPWEQTQRLLSQVDRRSPAGRRDFAILLLLVTYGLRAREIAALTLDNIDWRTATLRIPERKGAHSTQYRLTEAVGEALADYIEHVRPQRDERSLFYNVSAPLTPVTHHQVSARTTHWLKRAGIEVPRAGSHTLRHTVVQRLLDHGVSLKQIGDYVGHRSPDSTQIYTKIDLRHLREIASGYGEDVL